MRRTRTSRRGWMLWERAGRHQAPPRAPNRWLAYRAARTPACPFDFPDAWRQPGGRPGRRLRRRRPRAGRGDLERARQLHQEAPSASSASWLARASLTPSASSAAPRPAWATSTTPRPTCGRRPASAHDPAAGDRRPGPGRPRLGRARARPAGAGGTPAGRRRRLPVGAGRRAGTRRRGGAAAGARLTTAAQARLGQTLVTAQATPCPIVRDPAPG